MLPACQAVWPIMAHLSHSSIFILTMMSAPSTPPAYSTKELLAIRIPPASSHTHTDDSPRVAHASSANNAKYTAIQLSTLVPITDAMLDPFREYIDNMKTSWRSALAILRRGFDVRTEADVVTFLHNGGICAGWQAVLEMVPSTGRTYDLIATQEYYMKASCPVFESPTVYTSLPGLTPFRTVRLTRCSSNGPQI